MSERCVVRQPDVVWYDTPEAIQDAFIGGIAQLAGVAGDEMQWGGETEDGSDVEFTAADMLHSFRTMGMWGFCDGKRVHIWHVAHIPASDLVWLLAHEIAHLWHADAPDIAAEEEAGAELVAEIAAAAFNVVCRRLNIWRC